MRASIRENCALTSVFCFKKAVADCNARYIAKIEASERDKDGDIDALAKEAGPQGQLNRIIAGLDFND